MIDKITELLPDHTISMSASPDLYIVDFKNINGGGVELLETEPVDVKSVYLKNIQPIKIAFDGFKDNALPTDVAGVHNKQCECVVFPASCKATDWILFIETKYTNDLRTAFDENNDYPNYMANQIIATVEYFRTKNIIPQKKRVHAIVSFPTLIDEFSSYFFQGGEVEEILQNHRILIRATNSALIKSEKRITLNSI